MSKASDKSTRSTVVNDRFHAYSNNYLTCVLTLDMTRGGGMTSSRHRDEGDRDGGLDLFESSVFTGTGASDTVAA